MNTINEYKKGYKKTKVGWIPVEWEYENLETSIDLLTDYHSNGSYEKLKENISLLEEESYAIMVRTTNFEKNNFSKNLIFVNERAYNYLKKSKVFYNDIIINKIANAGATYIMPKIDKPTSLGMNLFLLRTSNAFDAAYIFFQLKKNEFSFKNLASGTGTKTITKDDVRKFKIPLPPLPEQKKIAQILTTWDKAIAHSQDLIAQLKRRKKGLMQQLLTGKTRLKGFGGAWEEARLSRYFTQRNETKQLNLPLLSVGINGVYPQDDSVKKDTSNSDKSKYKRICIGDIGYNTMRMWQGRSALSGLEGIVSPAYTIVTPKENADSLFFSYLFKLDYVIHRFYRNSQGLVSDTWQCRFKDFSMVKVSCPPTVEEQKAIAQVLTTADTEIQAQASYLHQLQAQKKGLMQQLLTGVKRVNV